MFKIYLKNHFSQVINQLTLPFNDFPLKLELRDISAFVGQCRPNAQHSIAAVCISHFCAK